LARKYEGRKYEGSFSDVTLNRDPPTREALRSVSIKAECDPTLEVHLDLVPGSSYEVASPNYPKKYPDYEQCYRQFIVHANTTLVVQCDVFDVKGGNKKCKKDYVELMWGISGDQTRYCDKRNDLIQGLRTEAFDEDYVLWFDFISDWRGRGKFNCTVRGEAGEGGPAPTVPPTETTPFETTPAPPTTSGPTEPSTSGPSSDCECGLQGTAPRADLHFIVGGVNADENEYPWQVALVRPWDSNGVFCGGTIINKRFVMTAAHCTEGQNKDNIRVKVGERNLKDENDNAKVIKIKNINNHPQYGQATNIDMDFSILELEEDLEFSESVRPACLPQSESNTYAGSNAVVTGWGNLASGGSSPDILQEVTVQVLENSNCGNYPQSMITDNMLCAGVEGKDSCQGDSGGPMVTEVDGRYTLIGVVSWGWGCADAGSPGVYARITSVLPWINNVISTGDTCFP